MTTQPDVLTAAEPFVQQCGPCDFGVITVGCNCPPGDYRPVMVRLMEEVERLRAGQPAPHLRPLLDLTADELDALTDVAEKATARLAVDPVLRSALDKLTTTEES